MKPKRIFLSLIFAAFSLTGCHLGNSRPTVTTNHPPKDNGEDYVDLDERDPIDDMEIIQPSAERKALLELYKPESMRGIDSLPQFMFDSYFAHLNTIEKNRVYDDCDNLNGLDFQKYYIDIDEDGDQINEVIGYPMEEMSRYEFSNFTYFEFDAYNNLFIDSKLEEGRISAIILEENIFGENVLILKHGYSYFACCAYSGSNNVTTYGTYKHIDYFHLVKDSKDKNEISVSFDKTYGSHKTVESISIGIDQFNVIQQSVRVEKGDYNIVPQEEIDYLNEYYDPTSRAPRDFFKYRLPEYSGESNFYYECEEEPAYYDANCKAKFYIQNTNSSDFADYVDLLEYCGFNKTYYLDDAVFSKPYDKDYDVYAIANYDSTTVTIRVYLVPYINTEAATALTEFPNSINGLNFSQSYKYYTSSARFYTKTIENYVCLFIYDTTQREYDLFIQGLVDLGFDPAIESNYIFTVETGSAKFYINAENLEVVPYHYITVQRVVKN